MTASVPVLLITGPVGVGKSTIASQAAWLLRGGRPARPCRPRVDRAMLAGPGR